MLNYFQYLMNVAKSYSVPDPMVLKPIILYFTFHEGFSQPKFYGNLVYKLKKIVGSDNFSAQFIKIISHYKKIGYNINVLQQTVCLVGNPITVGNFAFLFNCTQVGRLQTL